MNIENRSGIEGIRVFRDCPDGGSEELPLFAAEAETEAEEPELLILAPPPEQKFFLAHLSSIQPGWAARQDLTENRLHPMEPDELVRRWAAAAGAAGAYLPPLIAEECIPFPATLADAMAALLRAADRAWKMDYDHPPRGLIVKVDTPGVITLRWETDGHVVDLRLTERSGGIVAVGVDLLGYERESYRVRALLDLPEEAAVEASST